MPSVPPENIGDMLRLYQDQLELKDAHIAALTNLLKEANARLAQQQRISEAMIAAQPGTAASVGDHGDGLSPRGESSSNGASVLLDQRMNEADSTAYVHAVTVDYTANHGKELAFTSVSVPQEHTKGQEAEELVPSSIIRSRATEMVGDEPVAAPISMSYFGPPIANLAENFKEATAGSDPVALSEIHEPDEETYIALQKRLAEARARAEQSSPQPKWHIPVIATAVVALAAGAFFVPWKKLVGQLNAGGPGISNTAPPSGSTLPQHGGGLTTLPHSLNSTPGEFAAPKPENGMPLPSSHSNPLSSTPVTHETVLPRAIDTQLLDAISTGNVQLVRQMLDKGADVNARNENKSPALMIAIAAHRGSDAIVDQLLNRGADVNTSNDKGWTSLMLAVNSKRARIVDTLLLHGAHTDSVNVQGTTALMIAAQVGDKANVTRLLESGAPVLQENVTGLTARDMAIRKQHTDIAAILAQAATVKP